MQRIEKVKEAAERMADEPTVSATVDRFTLHDAKLGYVDQTRTPEYRLFLSSADLEVRDFSNRSDTRSTTVALTGFFMGSGKTQLDATFRPRRRDPELGMAVKIEHTDMRALNDLFRAYGDFDVVSGTFDFYSELKIEHRQISGYIKPLFSDVDVYDRRQDSDKALLQQLYEVLVGGIGGLLENRRDQVVTQAQVSGSAGAPDLSTWEVVMNLVRNAFIKTILPGFEHAVRESDKRAGKAPPG